MGISLDPSTLQLIEERMRRDGYPTADDVVRAALEHLDEQADLDDETLAAIEQGEAELDRGEGVPLDEAFARLRAKHGRERM